jgi:hypothetical protein
MILGFNIIMFVVCSMEINAMKYVLIDWIGSAFPVS